MKKRPSEFFLELARLGPVPHGREDATYGTLLSEAGFSRRPGAWTLREEAPVVLAAHLDTVAGRVPKGVRVVDGVAQGVEGALGADDKAGVALVLALAQDPPPGVGFALFLGEEVGCVGSEEALEAGLFRGARAVVSLDRWGKEEVIRAQLGQETASLEAASWLARRLGLGHRVSDRGVWTDSAVFAGVVPECLNLAVGYEGAHTDQDAQDLLYLDRLGEALRRVPWENLPVRRRPREVWRTGLSWGWRERDRVEEVLWRLKQTGLVEVALVYLLENYPDLVDELEDLLLPW